MRPSQTLWLWKFLAFAASAVCVATLWQARRQTAAASTRGEPGERAAFLESFRRDTANARDASERLSLAQLENALQHGTTLRSRCVALARIGRSPELDADAVERIAAEAGADRPNEVRRCALTALGVAAHPAAIEQLMSLAQQTPPWFAEAALRALVARDDPASERAALELAARGARTQRQIIATALAELGSSAATPLLVALLKDAPLHEQHALIAALGSTQDPRALAPLREIVAHGSRQLQYPAIVALGELGGATAVRTLLELLEQRPGLAGVVGNALARSGDADARTALIAAASDRAQRSRASAALMSLAELDGDDVRALMAGALGDGDVQRAQTAIDYFANHGDASAVPLLTSLTEGGSPQLSQSALYALSRIGDDEARATLERLASREGRLRDAALGALGSTPEGAERARVLAREQLRAGGAPSMQALELLANDGSEEARALLLEAAERGGSRSSSMAIAYLAQRSDAETGRALERIASGEGSADRRAAAVAALGMRGDAGALGTLQKALASGDSQVRARAVSALAELGGPAGEAAVLQAASDRDPEVASTATAYLAQLGSDAAFDKLERVAVESSPQVARQALQSLASVAPERAAPLAERLLQAKDAETRGSALSLVHALPAERVTTIVQASVADADENIVRAALDQVPWGMLDPKAQETALRTVAERSELPEDLRGRARALLAGQENAEGVEHMPRWEHRRF